MTKSLTKSLTKSAVTRCWQCAWVRARGNVTVSFSNGRVSASNGTVSAGAPPRPPGVAAFPPPLWCDLLWVYARWDSLSCEVQTFDSFLCPAESLKRLASLPKPLPW